MEMGATEGFMRAQIEQLEKENKKLKEYNGELIENHKKDIAILCEENKKLKEIIRNNVNGCPYGGFYCSQYLGL